MKAAYTNPLPFSLNEYGIAVCALLDIRPSGPESTVAEAALQLAVQNVTDPGILSLHRPEKVPETLLLPPCF